VLEQYGPEYMPTTVMNAIDRLDPAIRELVYEYGAQTVFLHLDTGFCKNIEELTKALEGQRKWLQQEWLKTDYVGRSRKQIAAAFLKVSEEAER
jgi:hypothetical protein